MEVKVGQVWLDDHDNEFVVDSCSNDMAMAKYAEFDTTIPLSKSFIVSSCSRIYESEPQLSDLEIVQKALDKSGGRLTYHHSNGWSVEDESSDLYFRNSGSLLAWAKQRIGEG